MTVEAQVKLAWVRFWRRFRKKRDSAVYKAEVAWEDWRTDIGIMFDGIEDEARQNAMALAVDVLNIIGTGGRLKNLLDSESYQEAEDFFKQTLRLLKGDLLWRVYNLVLEIAA